MRAYVGITDNDWFFQLSSRPGVDEVNFWKPGGSTQFKALQPGELFLFKLRAPRHFIVGGGWFAHFSFLPLSLAWESFGPNNGVASLEQLRLRTERLRRVRPDPASDYTIGCILLTQPFFLAENSWIPAPRDWGRETVQGKTYDLSKGEGASLWSQLERRVPSFGEEVREVQAPEVDSGTRFGMPTMILPRLGQGSFRVLVTDIYKRRCTVTGERTLPVLHAAHIKPYGQMGKHEPQNGLLLRSDLHTLFDRGYVTVTPERRFEVSRRIKEEFENGRDYYALHGRQISVPSRSEWAPAHEYLEWHANSVFRG